MFHGLIDALLQPSGLTPHGFCLLWEPGLIWTYATADGLIAVSYFTIPVALATLARRRSDLVFRPVFWLFAAFILLCGTTHLLDVVTLWLPAYDLQAGVKALTAAVSVVAAVTTWHLLPQAIALPSPTQFREAMEALQASETRHRTSFEHSPAPLYMLDDGDQIVGVSDSCLALLGRTREDVVGHRVQTFWAPGSAPTVAADRAELRTVGEVQDRERRFLRPDGSVIEALVTARLDRWEGTTLIVAAVADITRRRRAEEALHAAEERLRQSQKIEAIGQLTGGIAHDFNNMLQGIAGSLELMQRRLAQGRVETIGRYITTARQAVDNAATLTQRMLAFARRQALDPKAVEPDRLVRGMEELIRRTVGPQVLLDLHLRDGKWAARCDANQLENALLNLAINARDAMPEGGTLRIASADRTLTPADVADQEGAAPGCYVEIAVSDTGSGMPPEVLARAFEPFFTTKPIGQGTGLGLSQLYGFIRQSGGFVRLESRLGEGTMVRLFLPRQAETDDKEAAGVGRVASVADGSAAAQACGTILLVEDEAAVRLMVAEALREIGCEVLEAGDGPSALRIVQSREAVDLLVTDVGLPGMNGRQLAETVRVTWPHLPVLLISGYAAKVFAQVDLAPGMELMAKPFALDVLTNRVRAILEASRAGRAEARQQSSGG
jgi:PAS domain S-box-containing protein